MKIILFIDTTSSQVIKVGLNKNGKEFIIEQQLDKQKAQVVLPLIDRLLKKHNLTLKDIEAIHINPGPGSFTGVRVGLTIANMLAFLLKISVNGKPAGDFVEPIYMPCHLTIEMSPPLQL
jgi:tRNA threonylcarbamoyladenosine biosynthesis protein TsaB